MWQQDTPEEDEDYNFDQEYPAEGFSTDNYDGNILASQGPLSSVRKGPSSLQPPASMKGGPLASARGGPQVPGSRMGPVGSAIIVNDPSSARPMTSISAANYQRPGTGTNRFDPMGSNRGPAPALIKKSETSAEAAAREMEKKVNQLLEESAIAFYKGEPRAALEKAKEAAKRERQLAKQREANSIVDGMNFDLTYSVYFNLANMYHKNQMYQEALNTYKIIVKNKQYPQGGRMRVNMGNIYFEQQNYNEAIKMYRMAMDQIPNTAKEMRFAIMRNIGLSFIRLGQMQDAQQTYETIMETSPDYRAGINLILAHYATNNKEQLKQSFQNLINIRKAENEKAPEGEAENEEDSEEQALPPNDSLRQDMRDRAKLAERTIIAASKLIAPAIDKDFSSGFDYVVETLRNSKNVDLANDLEISKALQFMKKKDITKAIETLKEFEKKDNSIAAAAATNLAFLYFIEKDIKNAEKYSHLAIKADRYNAKAYVNRGNCFFVKQKLEDAKECYQEALSIESDCIEALYNLGLVNKRLGLNDKALQYFRKLHAIVPTYTEAIYQIAVINEDLGNLKEAEDKYKLLITLIPSDPMVLQRLGAIYAKSEDDILAHQYYMESYRHFPADLRVVQWLGAYYIKSEVYDKAINYFHRAAQLEPSEVKWQLMIASCHRRMRNYQQALEIYQEVHAKDPDNVECLRYIVQICNELGLKQEVEEYVTKLRKAEENAKGKGQSNQDQTELLLSQNVYKPAPKVNIYDSYDSNGSVEVELQASRSLNNTSSLFRTGSISSENNLAFLEHADSRPQIRKKISGPVDDDWGEDEIADDMLPL